MCIIAVKPEGLVLKEDVVKSMWDNNDDGAGFMYSENDQLVIVKGLMNFNEFLEAYEPHSDKGMVLHFRIRTHGMTNADMTHPFQVDESLAFAHNGIISGLGDATHSDTWYFNEQVIKKIREKVINFLDIDPIKELIEDKIGYSKLVFMDNKGQTTILNKDKGELSTEGIWFSNSSWKTRPVYQTTKYNRTPYNGYRLPEEPSIANPYAGWDYDGYEPIVPPSKTTPSTDTAFLQAGDYAILTEDLSVATYKEGALDSGSLDVQRGQAVRVTAFNQDGSVDARLLDNKRLLRIRSCLFLEKITTRGYLRKHWGHLQPGKKVDVIFLDDKYTRCIDPVLDRVYDIPSRLVFVQVGG